MGSDDEDLRIERIKHAGAGDLLQSGGTGGSSPWFEYVGDEPPHGPCPGGVPE